MRDTRRGEDSPPDNLEFRNVELLVEYKGEAFAGWQIQPNQRTVAGSLQQALQHITRHPVRLVAASRTDRGVHALGQVASFKTPAKIIPRRLRRGVNAILPPEVAVRQARDVPSDFHARFSAKGKHYRYRIFNRYARCPLEIDRAWHYPSPLDIDAMDEAAQYLVGRHDFASLETRTDVKRGTIRRLRAVRVRRAPAIAEHSTAGPPGVGIEVDVIGDSFLYKMVRTIAGTLVLVGHGKLRPAAIEGILAGRIRTQAGPTAPPQGLTLLRVFYDEHELAAAADQQLEGIVNGHSRDGTRADDPRRAPRICGGEGGQAGAVQSRP
ncbi:MAG: tRNA pseudouridine(38-40) synthase TruA [Planctomycetes bacterium]|nr:tRNA pseudouridine(38-40) synthase TruA [Planctomycetota bacterium]